MFDLPPRLFSGYVTLYMMLNMCWVAVSSLIWNIDPRLCPSHIICVSVKPFMLCRVRHKDLTSVLPFCPLYSRVNLSLVMAGISGVCSKRMSYCIHFMMVFMTCFGYRFYWGKVPLCILIISVGIPGSGIDRRLVVPKFLVYRFSFYLKLHI